MLNELLGEKEDKLSRSTEELEDDRALCACAAIERFGFNICETDMPMIPG